MKRGEDTRYEGQRKKETRRKKWKAEKRVVNALTPGEEVF